MKKEKLLFLIIPLIQVLLSLRYFKSYKQIVSSILFIASSFIISLILFKILSKFSLKYSISHKFANLIVVLVFTILDQINKLFLECTGLNCNIFGDYLQIKQTKNENQMAILNHFSIEPNITLIVIIKFLLLAAILFCLYRFDNKNLKFGFILLVSSQLSSFLDSLFRGYVLDSFYYYKLVCYDIKDYYVDAGIAIIIMSIVSLQNDKEKI